MSRTRETALRVALGAGLRQLAFHYALEGILVALPGALGGLLFSASVRLIVALVASTSSIAGQIAMDWKVVVFAFITALLAGGLTSIAPLVGKPAARCRTKS